MSGHIVLRQAVGIQGAAKDDESLKKIFRDKINHHINPRHQVFIPQQGFSQIAAEYCRGRREDQIISIHFQHRGRDVGRGPERETPVEGEIPDDGQNQSDQIAGPVAPLRQFS